MERLDQRIRTVLERENGITEKKMFGGICFMHRGNMLCGVTSKEEMMVRVGPAQYEAALAEPFAQEMDFTGRPMRGMVYVEDEGIATDAQLKNWLEWGLRFTRTLPKK